jgi:hypothetical protein
MTLTDQQLHSKAEKLASELNDNYVFVAINGKAVIIPSAADAIFRELREVRDHGKVNRATKQVDSWSTSEFAECKNWIKANFLRSAKDKLAERALAEKKEGNK